jgi:hypothetical protein
MKRLVRLPSPAMLVALTALFVSLGGVSYGLATGSIDSREIKNNTIRTQDIRNNEVRGRDIRNSTIRSEDIAANQVKGADVLESSLGQVPKAKVADSAGTLSSQAKIDYKAGPGSAAQTIYDSGRLKLTASCGAAQPTVTASTSVPNATLHSTGGAGGANDTASFTADVPLTLSASEQRTVVYTEPGGQVVTVSYAAVGGAPYGTPGCIVKGLAETL